MTFPHLPSSLSLANSTALITGAGSPTGIGFACAVALGELGARVIVTGTTERIHERVAELEAQGIDALGIVCTLDSEAGAASLSKSLADVSAQPTIVVNNAGMVTVGEDTIAQGDIEMSTSQWDATLAMNLTTAFHATRAVVPFMRSAKWGRIINISSVNGAKGQAGQTNYSAAKAGMHGFSMALAQELANKGVTVNTVSPGYIGTDMVKAIRPDVLEKIVATIPVKRLGRPEEIGSIVAWLAGDDAGFTTGANFSCNGGLHMG